MIVAMLEPQRDNRALCATTHRAREMQQRAGAAAAGKNESAQRRQFGFEPIDPGFKPCDGLIVDRRSSSVDRPGAVLSGRVGEASAEREEIFLQLFLQIGDVGSEVGLSSHHPEACIQFVDVAVSGHAWVGLGHAEPAEEAGVTSIPRARVNLHGRQYT